MARTRCLVAAGPARGGLVLARARVTPTRGTPDDSRAPPGCYDGHVPTSEAHQLEVVGREVGTRLDRFLVRHLPGASRAAVRRLIDEGQVTVDDRPCRKGQQLASGSLVVVTGYVAPGSWEPELEPDIEVDVLHEDDDMVIVDKPPGLPCHPLRPGERGTVAGVLLCRYPELAGVGPDPREAGLVHRLDTGTSGVLVFARRKEAYHDLVRQLRRGTARKRYRALVEGDASALERIDVPLATAGQRVRAVPEGSRGRPGGGRPRPAETLVEPLERLGAFTFVSATIHAGRRHQIRAHLAWAGHPVARDRLYGAELAVELTRPFLHAIEVRLQSPSRRTTIRARAQLAPDLEELLAELRAEGA